MTNFRFSLFRLMMAVTVFSGAFSFVKMIGASWQSCPWLIGVPMALLVLVVKPRDKLEILESLKVCWIGIVGGLVFAAMIGANFSYHPAAIPTAALMGVLFAYAVRFCIWFFMFFTNWQEMKHSYWEEWDAKTGTGKLDEVRPNQSRKLHHDQAGTQAD